MDFWFPFRVLTLNSRRHRSACNVQCIDLMQLNSRRLLYQACNERNSCHRIICKNTTSKSKRDVVNTKVKPFEIKVAANPLTTHRKKNVVNGRQKLDRLAKVKHEWHVRCLVARQNTRQKLYKAHHEDARTFCLTPNVNADWKFEANTKSIIKGRKV